MSRLPIVTVDQRLAEQCIKGVIFGPPKIGKTSLLWTLDAESTLFVDLEAGGLSVQGWPGDSIEVRDWQTAINLACFIGGPDPSKQDNQPYSQAHYDFVCGQYGDPAQLEKYKTIFVDSITVAGRLCYQAADASPEAVTSQGKKDQRKVYGTLGIQMVQWLTHLQHTKGKHVWFVGILDEVTDDFNRTVFQPQIEGSKTGRELPGIVDQVISMVELTDDAGTPYRAFICKRPNMKGYPAGDRSGRLEMIEPPHLGRLMEKILGPVRPAPERLGYEMPGEAKTEEAANA